MIEKILFGDDKLRLLKTALGAYSERGRVHSANVANAETPGYHARELRFEEDLQLALRTETAGKLSQTNSRHLPSGAALPTGKTVLAHPSSEVSGNGINDVEIDREMASIAENTVRYTVAAELVTRAYAQMKAAIRGRALG